MVAIVDQLLEAYDTQGTIGLITEAHPEFGMDDAYDVLHQIEAVRLAQRWLPIGRKIGFTNTTIWARYGVSGPMWARLWDRTVHFARGEGVSLPLDRFVQPRIEPEVVFKLAAPLPATDDPAVVLACVEWIAAGFEIVQCHFADWKFAAPDCTAAFGLHGALVVGTPLPITDTNRDAIAAALPAFDATLSCRGSLVERGRGSNVLGSPALALAHLCRTVANQPQFGPLAAGEIVTTGTLTDAWPIAPGERWESDYGSLGVEGLTVDFS